MDRAREAEWRRVPNLGELTRAEVELSEGRAANGLGWTAVDRARPRAFVDAPGISRRAGGRGEEKEHRRSARTSCRW